MSYVLAASLDKMRGALPFERGIDDFPDQMNRNTMARIMTGWAVISTFTQLIGQNISCFGFIKFTKEFADDYCWTQGIYTHRLAYHTTQTPYPGIAPCVGKNGRYECAEEVQSKDKIMHIWYQWVPFYFMGVAVAYYIPYLILKTTKLRKVKPLITMLKDQNIINEHPTRISKKIATWIYNEVVYPRYAITSITAKFWSDFGLVFGLIIVKLLYFCVAVAHLFVTAKMFKIGDWITYGMLFSVNNLPTTNVKDVLFPKMAACRIVKWGTTGQEPETGMCILAPNVTNQYLFLIMWYLNILLIFINAISWIYTMFKVFNPNILHTSIISSSMMHSTEEFNKMFKHVGPSGQIVISKISESMSGYILAMVSARVNKKLSNLHKRRMSKMTSNQKHGGPDYTANKRAADYTRMNSAPAGIDRNNLGHLD